MDMFYNYDNNIEQKLDQICPPPPIFLGPTSHSNIALLYNIKKEPIGVEVKHRMPFTLYFNLNTSCGCPLIELISKSIVCFELLSTTHKVIFSKKFSVEDIFNPITNDLVIAVSQEEIKDLRQETYKVKLTLIWPEGEYTLYSETDGILCIR